MFKLLRNRKERQALKANPRAHSFLSFDQIETILILFDSKEINQVVRLAKELRSLGKNVLLWTSVTREETIRPMKDADGLSLRVITPQEKSKLNILSAKVLDEFKALKYDMLLDFSSEDNIVMSYLAANTTCSFCIGLREAKNPIYDFIYLKGQDQDFLDAFGQIKNYLDRCVSGNK